MMQAAEHRIPFNRWGSARQPVLKTFSTSSTAQPSGGQREPQREQRVENATASVRVLNQGLRIFFSEFVRVSLRHPSQAAFFARTVFWQGKAARLRARHARGGLHVPPIVIFSITNECNLLLED
jgi:hypothetical protein